MRTLLLTLVLVSLGACRTEPGKDGDSDGLGGDPDADGDGYPASEDCDDASASTNPGAVEVCDGVDNDCDDDIDEGVLDTWYADSDGDGYGDPGVSEEACDGPEGFVPSATDCDDGDDAVYPSADEVCNGVDDDCNGEVDDGALRTWYVDADGDGHGDPEQPVEACEQPSGAVADADDCDDTTADALPGGIEVCDGVDNDCDNLIDEDEATDAPQWYADVDGDGYGDPDSFTYACETPTGYVDQARDCDDQDPDVRPDAPEVCDGIDNDCDTLVDDDDPGVDTSAGSTWYADTDGDGYGDPSAGATTCAQPTGTVADATDCDDTAIAVNPGATEVCNTIDDDCDGDVDDADSSLDTSTASTWYADADIDGYGDASSSTLACAQPSGTVADATDCDDTESGVNPGALEVCDGSTDEDCDGDIDEDDASDAATWYADDDLDGYGDATDTTTACDEPSGYVDDDSDCDDTDIAINPAADEVCDGSTDEDCDGDIDEDDAIDASTWYADDDGDSYGDSSDSTQACDQPTGYVADDTDCDDTNPSLYVCTSCNDILAAGGSTGDGIYQLDPCGSGAADYWCDMTTDGGGWTVAGWQAANATTSMGISDWGTVGGTAWSSDLACIDFSEIMVENHTLGQSFQQSYSLQTWAETSLNIAIGSAGTAFKHGTYGPSGSLIVMGCVDYAYGGGVYSQYACDTDGTRSAKGHLADYAGEYCSGGRLDYTWAWSNGSSCTSRGTTYTWGYAIR